VPKNKDKDVCCAPDNTGHHLVPAHCFTDVAGYDADKAPCVCAGGWSWHRKDKSGIPDAEKSHPAFHEVQDVMERRVIAARPVLQAQGKLAGLTAEKPWRYGAARNIGIATHKKVFKDSECSADCVKAQLDDFHKPLGIDESTPVKAKKYGNTDKSNHPNNVAAWEARAKAMGVG
jgi:hypothetical protein